MTARVVRGDVAPEADAPLTPPTLTIKIEARFCRQKKWARQGSNLGPMDYESLLKRLSTLQCIFK